MDTAYFMAPFGPTTTERHDPQFYISPQCCWWSGNSWPYATAQTLVAMANLINEYEQSVVSSRDWMTLFDIYTRTQRKDTRPYIAEAANPQNGSWDGHDTPYHSEHYFHSAYVNVLITASRFTPRADDSVEGNPLAPSEWSTLPRRCTISRATPNLPGSRRNRYRRDEYWSFCGRQVMRAPGADELVANLGKPRSTRRQHRC